MTRTKNQVGTNAFLFYWVVCRRPNKPKPELARLSFSLILLALFLNFQAWGCSRKGRFYILVLPTYETVPSASNF